MDHRTNQPSDSVTEDDVEIELIFSLDQEVDDPKRGYRHRPEPTRNQQEGTNGHEGFEQVPRSEEVARAIQSVETGSSCSYDLEDGIENKAKHDDGERDPRGPDR